MRYLALALFPLALVVASGAPAFDGCPPGTVTVKAAPDGRAYSALLSAFQVLAGDAGRCNLQVPILPLSTGTIAVYSADYRGATAVADNETAILAIEHDGIVEGKSIVGPFDNNSYLIYSNLVASGPGDNINSIVTFDLTNAADPFSFGALDSIDYLELARTTMESVQGSIDDLSATHTAIVTHLDATASLLTGAYQRLEGVNEVSVLGAFGSYTVGGTARRNLANGFSILGGAALLNDPAGSATGVLASGALRYVQPGDGTFRYYGEFGLVAAPSLDLSFSRQYINGAPGGATITSNTTGSLTAAYVTGGLLFAPAPNNEIAFSGTLMRDWLTVNGFAETFTTSNLFAASTTGGTGTFDRIEATGAWTTTITPEFDATFSASLGTMTAHDDVAANVAFVGPVNGARQSEVFAEYGARLGWKLNLSTTVDVFVIGASGTISGGHIQIGSSLRMKF